MADTTQTRVIRSREGFVEAVAQASQSLLGRVPDQIFAPGGSFRESIRLAFPDGNVVLTRRKARARGRLEAECLRRLSAEGAPVPRLLAYDGTWLAQEHVPGQRLSIALARATDPADRCTLAEDAVGALSEIADAAARSDLAEIAPPLGASRDWVARVVARPARLAERLSVPLPPWNAEACVDRLAVPCAAFVKWDARPANAIVDPDGRVVWIDWEHAGCRHGVEDFAWLSADEYFTARVEDVVAALGRELDARTPGAAAERLDYLAIFAAMHAAVRLELILNKLDDAGWQDPEELLRRDLVGASRPNAALLLRNAADWSARSPLTAPLSGWYAQVAEAVAAK